MLGSHAAVTPEVFVSFTSMPRFISSCTVSLCPFCSPYDRPLPFKFRPLPLKSAAWATSLTCWSLRGPAVTFQSSAPFSKLYLRFTPLFLLSAVTLFRCGRPGGPRRHRPCLTRVYRPAVWASGQGAAWSRFPGRCQPGPPRFARLGVLFRLFAPRPPRCCVMFFCFPGHSSAFRGM